MEDTLIWPAMDGYGCMTTEQARQEMDRDEFEAFVSAKIARREMEWG